MTVPPPEDWGNEFSVVHLLRLTDKDERPGVHLEVITDMLHVRDCPFCDTVFEAGLRKTVMDKMEYHMEQEHPEQEML